MMHSILQGMIGQLIGGTPVVDNDFVIRVKTDNAGTSASDQFTIPTFGAGYNYNITTDEHSLTGQTGSVTLTFSTAGEYVIRISGTFPRIYFNNGGDKLKLIRTLNFGDVGWANFANSFYGCSNNVIDSLATGNFANVASAQNAWLNNTSNNFFPEIGFSICTNFQNAWINNTLTSFPLIDMGAATRVDSAWKDNLLTSFPSIDFPNCANFEDAWINNSLTTIPLANYGLSASNVIFQGAWKNNNLDTVPALNLSTGTDFGGYRDGAWSENGVISSFACRNFYNMTDGNGLFYNTTLPTSDYSDILITQNANNANTGVTLDGGNSVYDCLGSNARDNLVNTKLWSITDGGLDPLANCLWTGLESYYTADNTPNDAIGTANGTLINGATYSTGIINQGFSLDGVNDYVDLGDNFDFDSTTPFSFSFWINKNTTANQAIFTRLLTSPNVQGYQLAVLSGNTIRLAMYNLVGGGGFVSVRTNATIASSTWLHVVATYDGSQNASGIKIYIDGVNQTLTVESSGVTGSTSVATTAKIGSRASDFYFNGLIDEGAIFSRELTASDVTDLYNLGAGRQYPT